MKVNIQEIQTPQEEWPVMLTPELREKLLLDKLARAQKAVELRRKYPKVIREDLNIVCCNDHECYH